MNFTLQELNEKINANKLNSTKIIHIKDYKLP